MLQNLLHGFTALGNGQALLYLFAGALIGMFLGVIPGLGGAVVLSIILSFVNHVNLLGTLCLFLGTQAGSYYSASITSILLNTPAHPEAFAVTLDGFPMAQKGELGRALGLSAASTCIGGLIGCGVLVGFIQVIDKLPGAFHPPEYVALVVLAMFLVGTLGTDSVGKAIAAAGAGLMVSSIGPSVITGTFRYTFNAIGLQSGISLVGLALGCFAIPQMVMVFGSGTTVAKQDMTGKEVDTSVVVELKRGFGKQVMGGVLESFRHWVVMLQGGLTGALTGIVPGVGGFAANFLSYGIAQQTSKKKHLFGTGIPEGIIAPEGASLAKEAGTMIPIIGLGIPGGVGGALFIAALMIKGIRTGYGFTASYPILPYEIVWIIALSGIIGTVAGVLTGPFLAKVTKVPGPVLVPFIFSLSVLGAYLGDVTYFAVMEVVVFGVIGLVLRRLRYPLGSFILGLVLGPTFETNVTDTHAIYHGATFLTARPFADVLMAIAIGVLILKVIEIRKGKRKRDAELANEIAHLDNDADRSLAMRNQDLRANPYPLLALIASTAGLAIALYFIVFGWTHYDFTTAAMPIFGGLLVALPMFTFVPRDIYRYLHFLRMKKAADGALVTSVPVVQTELSPVFATLSGLAPDDAEIVDLPDNGGLDAVVLSPSSEGRLAALVKDRSWGSMGQYRRECIAFLWFGGLVALCYIFGFVWGIPAFMLAYGATCTKYFFTTRVGQAIFTVFSAVLMWVVTYEMIQVVHLFFTPKINF